MTRTARDHRTGEAAKAAAVVRAPETFLLLNSLILLVVVTLLSGAERLLAT